jgi:RND family efflux transporter MFP subunit
MNLATPRLRQDLVVTPLQDADGIAYYDVSDPRTGGILRLYDFEWLVAEQLDGRRSLEDLARWAQDHLGLSATSEDLSVYVQRLAVLGLFDTVASALPVTPQAHAPLPLPEAVPAAVSEPVRFVPVRTPEAAAAPVAPAAPPTPPAAPPEREAEAQPPRDDQRSAPLREERRATLMMPTVAPGSTAAPAAAPAPEPEPPLPRIELPVTVSPPEMPTLTPIAPTPLSERPTAPLQAVAAGAEPEVLTGPAAAPQETAPQEAGAEAGLGFPRIKEREQASGPEASTAPLPEVSGPGIGPSIDIRIDTVSGEPKSPASETPAQVAAEAIPRATVPQERVKQAAEDELEETPGTSRAGRWIALLVVLLALAGVVYFLLGLNGKQGPSVGVRVQRAQPQDVNRTLSATAVLQRGAGTVLKMEVGGVLASVVSEGAEVSAGMSLAALEAQPRLQKDLTEVRERLAHYQRRRDVAKEKGDESAEREAQSKIREKEERLAKLEADLKKTQLLSPRAGKVTRVMAHAGDLVAPGSEVVEIADRFLSAELRLPAAEAKELKEGQELILQGAGGASVTGRIAEIRESGSEAIVRSELAGEAPDFKPGAELKVVRGRLRDVVELPASALLAGDAVYVVSAGQAMRHKVTVLEKQGAKVLVSGLGPGDEVIVGSPSELREGQPVRVLP